jgi:RteC protein
MKTAAVDIIFSSLDDELVKDLEQLSSIDDGKIDTFKKALDLCNAGIEKLDEVLTDHRFADEADEIYFFKVFKPQFLSRQFYYISLLQFEIRKPIGAGDIAEAYCKKTLEKLHHFLEAHTSFCQYYRSGATYLDHLLFRRYQEPDSEIFPFNFYGLNKQCSTKYDILLAKVMANELIARHFLNKQQAELHRVPGSDAVRTDITWSASKVALAELLYALHASGVLSNSPLEIKALSEIAANVFQVQMGNIYKVFEEIRLRKKNRTAFLDLLKTNLIQRMDMDDDKSL